MLLLPNHVTRKINETFQSFSVEREEMWNPSMTLIFLFIKGLKINTNDLQIYELASLKDIEEVRRIETIEARGNSSH